MRAAIRWSIAIIGTLAAFALVTWLSAVAGMDEGWALGLGALAAALVLAGLQTWATSRHRSSDDQRPAAETPINKIDSPDIDGSVVQAGQVRDIYINAPPAASPQPAAARLEPKYPIRVGDVPQRPPAFQPRTDLFEQIAAADRVAVVQTLTGARGVGKTQLAAEYARQCIADGWQLVAWIPAEEPGQALAGLTELAEKLSLRYMGEDASSAVRKVRHWLESSAPEDCLVVFDNAVDLDSLRPWVPATGHARIIITSNHHAFGDLGTAINVDVFTPAEAAAFLRTRIESGDDRGAKRLADELDRLPLALAQSAGVIRQQKLTYEALITRLREQPIDQYLQRGGDPYPLRAAQAVLLALAAIEATDPLARPLLTLLAVLSPEGLPRSLVQAAAAREPTAASPADVDRTLGRLGDASLITLSIKDQRVIMHRFTQRVIRDRAHRALCWGRSPSPQAY